MKVKKIKPFYIYGVKYPVRVTNLLAPIIGTCDRDKKQIYIESCIESEDLFLKTLLHEVCHGLVYESGLSNVISQEVEELICIAMEKYVDLFDIKIKK